MVPADEFLSGSEAGGLDFLAGYLTERSDLRDRVERLVTAPDPTAHPDWDWFAELVGGGILVDEFIPLPGDAYRSLSAVGLIPRWGPGAKHRWPASAADRAPVSTRRAPAGWDPTPTPRWSMTR